MSDYFNNIVSTDCPATPTVANYYAYYETSDFGCNIALDSTSYFGKLWSDDVYRVSEFTLAPPDEHYFLLGYYTSDGTREKLFCS